MMNSAHITFVEFRRVTQKPPRPPVCATYRHDDLRHALLDTGVEPTRAGGPEAIVLREATRRTGVAPNAAYRHFTERLDLLQAIRAASLAVLARAIEAELESIDPTWPAGARTHASPRTVGVDYLRFAQMETGLFRTAFVVPGKVENSADPARVGDNERNPFQPLGLALDRMTAADVLPVECRPGAKYFVWSVVHGLTLFVIGGPLRNRPPERTGAIALCAVEMVENGL